MTDQWTPTGDKWPQPAMVMVRDANGGHCNILLGVHGASDWVPRAALRPMPPAITPEQQAVLDAVKTWIESAISREWNRKAFGFGLGDMYDAGMALRAAQQPPDPVKELLEAAKAVAACDFYCSTAARDRLRIAIAALKAKS